MEFKPGELPPAEAVPAPVDQDDRVLEGEKLMSLPAWLAFGSAMAILLLIVVNAAVTFAVNAVRDHSIMDFAFFVALIVFVSSIGYVTAWQTRALRKLKSAERAREMAAQLAKLDGAGSGVRLLGALHALYSDNAMVLGKLNAASSGLQPHHSDRDVIELLNREVFAPMDREADDRIQKAAIRASLGVSSCPHPSLDALVVLAISLLLIRDLMSVYGLRHSSRSLYRVLTRALFVSSSTAVMSTVVEFGIKAAQDRLAAAVVGTAGEALVVARRMFALGALAKAEIRPLPTT
jgi:putative membrane protein